MARIITPAVYDTEFGPPVAPAVLRCDCRGEVELWDPMTNACDRCGRLYNGSGQALRPEDEWEENYEPYEEDY